MSDKTSTPRKHVVFVMRAGERMDRMFPQWLTECFQPDRTGKINYTLTDLNMPVRLPRRSDGPQGFQYDSPLTEFGNLQECPQAVYTSPALRCVQTAAALLGAAKSDVKVRVEPALADTLAGFTRGSVPKYMSMFELVSYAYPIDVSYTPIMNMARLTELLEGAGGLPTPQDDYCRVSSAANALCRYKLKGKMGGCTIVIGHAHTLDAFSRTLINLPVPKRFRPSDAHWMGLRYPYASAVALQSGAAESWVPASEKPPMLSYMDRLAAVDWDYLNRGKVDK